MAKKLIEYQKAYPDTYRIRCIFCTELFEAENEDFTFIGNDKLMCECPWCNKRQKMNFRSVRKAKICYGPTYSYEK